MALLCSDLAPFPVIPWRHAVSFWYLSHMSCSCPAFPLRRVEPHLNQPQALCTCPTRELVVQNLSVLQRIGKFSKIRATSTATHGSDDDAGNAPGAQRRSGPITEQVVIGTHGTLKAWVTKRMLSLENIRIMVFDEADEMLRMDGFGDDSVRLIRSIRKKNPQVRVLPCVFVYLRCLLAVLWCAARGRFCELSV